MIDEVPSNSSLEHQRPWDSVHCDPAFDAGHVSWIDGIRKILEKQGSVVS